MKKWIVLIMLVLPAVVFAEGKRYIIALGPGPNWDYGSSFARQSGSQKHKKFWKKQEKGKKVVAGGAFAKKDEAIFIGAKGVTKKELRQLAKGDPLVKKGVLKIEIREWRMYFDLKEPKADPSYADYDPADYEDIVDDEEE